MTQFKLKKQEATENEVLDSICEYLQMRRHFFFRTNNTPIFQSDGRGGGFFRRMSKWAIAGVPDIICLDKTGTGIMIGIEVKRKSGKQSEDQKLFQQKMEEHGGEYILAKSIDDLIVQGL